VNQNFSKALKAIRSGKAIVLTERGKPIAKIIPIGKETKENDELQALRDEGFLIGRAKSGVMSARPNPHCISGQSASGILRKERDED
jgi:antitoxin (DNA-binding transcriptional repressor) of toxin-antitoxin stability system